MIRKEWLFLCFFSWMLFTPIVGFSDWWNDQSPYIFEGKVVSQYFFFTKDREIRACSTVKILKIFKGLGVINLGLVNIITNQTGCVDENNCIFLADYPPGIMLNHEYLFVSKDAELKLLVSGFPAVDNKKTLQINLLGVYGDPKLTAKFPDIYPEVVFNKRKFNEKNEFYNFLKSNYGLSVQAESSEQINNPKLQTTPDTVKVVR